LSVDRFVLATPDFLTTNPSSQSSSKSGAAVAFIDTRVDDYQSLTAGVKAGTEVHVLDPLQDAVAQITQTLMGRSGIASLHILSHGTSGSLTLGSTLLNLDTLSRNVDRLKSWSAALTENADILLYGCDVAEGDRGLNFIQQFSHLTGADVAASQDRTGATDFGGNWTLEVNTGEISASLIFEATTLERYHHVLPVDLLSSASVFGSNTAGGSIGTSSTSSDGKYVVFSSSANDLTADDRNPGQDVFLLDRSNPVPKVTLISRNLTNPASTTSTNAVISADGNYVAFVSNSTNLDAEVPYTDTRSNNDVFVWERSTGKINLVSRTTATTPTAGDFESLTPVISDNGNYIAFLSRANNLSPISARNNTRTLPDVFLYDRTAKTVSLVSRNINNTGGGRLASSSPVISGDGNYVAFSSNADDLEPTASSGIFVWNRVSDEMIAAGPGGSNPVINQNGSRIAFSTTTAIAAADNNGVEDVYLWDRTTGIELVSFNATGTASGNSTGLGGSGSSAPVISSDGNFVAFTSFSTDLVTGIADNNTATDVFVRDFTNPLRQTFLVSQSEAAAIGDGASSNASISANGKQIAFTSLSSNLVANDTNAKRDVFVRDLSSLVTPKTILVSRNTAGTIGNQESATSGIGDPTTPIVSGDGKFVVFSSRATNLISSDGNGAEDTFINDVQTGTTSIVSFRNTDPALASVTGNGDSNTSVGAVSEDGRYVIFVSKAPELVANDNNAVQDVFIRDVQTGTVTLVSGSGTGTGNGISGNPVISRDGRYVVFTSVASNLVVGDANARQDVFLWDRLDGSTRLVSGVNGGSDDVAASISRDGRYVVFISSVSNLVANDTNNQADVFLWDRQDGSIRLISGVNADTSSNGSSDRATISSDGRYVAFTSNASNLPDNAAGRKNVFVWDRQDSSIKLLNRTGATIGDGTSEAPVISGNGRFVAFVSTSSNLGGGTDSNNAQDVFVYDLQLGTTTPISLSTSGVYSTGASGMSGAKSEAPVISNDGRFVAFTSTFSDLVPNDANDARDVFVRDLVSNRTILISSNKDGTASGTGVGVGGMMGGSGSFNPVISSDGRFVAFVSFSNNLVDSDTNNTQDVFVRDLLADSGKGKTQLVSQNLAGTSSGNGASFDPAIDAVGSYIAFTSEASNLVNRDLNNKADVFGAQLANTVRIESLDGTAIEATKAATYKITRSTTQGNLTIKLAIDVLNTASTSDYTLTIGATAVTPTNSELTIVIPDGTGEVVLTLTPTDDNAAESNETIKLNLLAGDGYVIPTGAENATATIAANDTTVTNTNDIGEGSLRQAILNANAFAGVNAIDFKIDSVSKTINLASALPMITDAVIIDGTTQSGYVTVTDAPGAPIVELNGANAGAVNGLVISAGNSTVTGLAINRFAQDGIRITAGTNQIQKNLITGNGGAGIAIVNATGNRIGLNAINNNAGLGIDLDGDGITANDLGDGDTGANNLQNYPLLLTAEPTGENTIVSGTLNSTASKQFRVEFFSNDVADAAGNGEGQTYLGFRDVTTDADGNAAIAFSTTGALTGKFISATATDIATGDTSEFSTARVVVAPKVSIAPSIATLPEGNLDTKPYNFVITLDRASSQTVKVNYSTENGLATAGSDYTGATNAEIEFAPGETTKTIAINITGDVLQEADEDFKVTLSTPTNATFENAIATGIIQNDDTPPIISVANLTKLEGQTGDTPYVFEVTLASPSGQIITVNYATGDDTAKSTEGDYTATSGQLTFAPGVTSQLVTVLAKGDVEFEPNEQFKLLLTGATNTENTTASAIGILENDDNPPPTFSVTNLTKLEGQSGDTPYVFEVTLSNTSGKAITIDYTTGDDTAQSLSDYTAASGQLTFAPGVTSQLVTVLAKGDVEFEPNEQFKLLLTGATNTENTAASAIGILENDDNPPPTFSVTNLTKLEGQTGDTPYVFEVTLASPSAQIITVNYATGDDTAKSTEGDYTATSGQLTFAPGVTSQLVTVLAKGDVEFEPNEQFKLLLTGATNTENTTASAIGILENDDNPPPTFSVTNLTKLEGQTGDTPYVFEVTLASPSGQIITVNYATGDDTAKSTEGDYTATSGQLTFAPGVTSQLVTVLAKGDVEFEPNEQFKLLLTGATNTENTTASAIGILENDDNPPPTFSVTNLTKLEGQSGDTPYVFEVTLSNTSGKAITIDYTTGDDTAQSLSDYTAASGQLTFAPGVTSQLVTVLAKGDTTLEGTEQFKLLLSNATNTQNTTASAIGILENDDEGAFISVGNVTQVEGSSGQNAFVFNVTLSQASGLPVSVDYTTADDSATILDSDYTATSGTLTFTPGQTVLPVTVLVTGDNKFEDNDRFLLKLSKPINGAIITGNEQALGTITNDDAVPTVAIVANPIAQAEGNTTAPYTFNVTLSNPSYQPITVNYATADGTATTLDSDYVSATGQVTFDAGETLKVITVNVTGDDKRESDETFRVNLTDINNQAVGNTIATISNDDPIPTISIGNAAITEGNGGNTPIVLNVTLSNRSDQPVTVNYITEDSSATAGDNDYEAVLATSPETVIFAAGETIKPITINVKGDTKLESAEQFSVKLSTPTGGTIANGTAIATINNDDNPPALSIDNIEKKEGDTGLTDFVFTVSLSSESTQEITVDYATTNGSATTNDLDYTAVSKTTLTFAPGQTSRQITVQATGDTKREVDENFNVILSNAVNSSIAKATGIGTIQNDDQRPTIGIGKVDDSESGIGQTKNFTFAVTLSNPTIDPVTVNYTTTDGTATIADGDYTLNAGSLTFNANETIKFITVQAKGDNKFETDEQFTIDFSNVVNADISTGAGQGVGTIKNDDDKPKISINSVNLNEGRTGTTPFIFDITLSNPSSQPISVDFTTKDGAAQAGTDYIAQTGKVTFDPTQTSKQITVLVNGDATVELDEDFSVELSNPTNADIASAIGRGAILNDDQPIRPTISIDNPSLGEGNSGTTPLIFKVILSEATSIPVSVQYGTIANTAKVGEDYTTQTGALNFAAGETLKEITIAVNGDSTFEPTEDFAINLSAPVNADVSTIAGRGIGTIVNDDAKPKITIDSITQPEGATGSTSEYSFKVSLSNPSSVPISVRYQTADGTATIADQDYQSASDTLTFNPGELTKLITVRVNGDSKFEPEENFFVRLTNLTPANADISPDPGQGVGTIQADDFRPTISIASPAPQNEGNGAGYNFVVSLSNPSSETVSVNFATADGTARVQNSDYTFNAGTLTFLPNETSKTIVVNAITDSQFELDETFAVNLTSPTNATLITSTATATILNDDPLPAVSISNATPQKEGNTGITPYTFVISLSQPSPQPITVRYNTANGTATLENNDYTAAADLITFAPGDTSKTITVNALGDTRFEPNETFAVNLTSPTNATIATATATATLTNDDLDPGANSDLGALWVNADATEAQIWQFNTSTYNKTIDLPTGIEASWTIAAKADFDKDGDLDLFWYNTRTGQTLFWQMNGSQYETYHPGPVVEDRGWVVAGVGDFNGDRKPELLWHNQRNGDSLIWVLDQFNYASYIALPNARDLACRVQGVGDFNGDGRSDVLWRNYRNGDNILWLMNGTSSVDGIYLPTAPDINWQVAGIGDFNNDSSLDLLWRNYNTGDNAIWQLDRTRFAQNFSLRRVEDPTWRIEEVGDYNRDGNLDILWHNASGSNAIWYLNGVAFGAGIFLPARDATWTIAETGDFDRDGNLDVLWRNYALGKADIWKLNGSPYTGTVILPKMDELGWKFQGTGDFNRDGSLDIVWRNYITGDNKVWLMNGAQFLSSVDLLSVRDLNYQIRGVGDFDRDGNPDLLWYNVGTGDTGFWKMNGTTYVNSVMLLKNSDFSWDISTIRDFDNDGDLDVLLRNRSTGQIGFWILNNMTFFAPIVLSNPADLSWKLAGVGDFNRDRNIDLLWRNSRTGENSVWLMNGISYGTEVYLPTVKDLGWDVAGVRDFGGDANVDIFWRNAQSGDTGLWYMDGTKFNLGYYLPRWTDTRWKVEGLEEFKTTVS
jgi:hypothetical protein